MLLKTTKTVFTFILIFVITSPCEEKIRAVFLIWPYKSDNTYANSDASFQLYKKLGYNTIFESLPLHGSTWDKKNAFKWHLKTTRIQGKTHSRAQLVNYIKSQKTRLQSFGLEYCPFYNPFAHAQDVWNLKQNTGIDERGAAAIYRNIRFLPGKFDLNIFPRLKNKHIDSWSSPANCGNWEVNRVNSEICITIDHSKKAWLGVNINTITGKDSFIDSLLYEFTVDIVLDANLKQGDRIYVNIYRQFKSKPSPNIPFNNYYKNQFFPLCTQEFVITSVNKKKYEIMDVVTHEKNIVNNYGTGTFKCKKLIWLDTKIYWGKGYEFKNAIRWEFTLNTTDADITLPRKIWLKNFSIEMKDPRPFLMYKDWEQSSNYSMFLSRYPTEKHMTTRATYKNDAKDSTINFFRDTLHAPWSLKKVSGHFMPLSQSIQNQSPSDPFSPVRDLIIKDILQIIDTALIGEPKYYFLNADEMFLFRRDAISNKDINHAPFRKMSNLEYFASLLLGDIKRYRDVFRKSDDSTKTNFVFWGDMILPFGKGYNYIAERDNDNDAFQFIKNHLKENNSIIPIIWIYDYMKPPGKQHSFMLNNPLEIQKSLNMVAKNDFKYMIAYATDGKILSGDMRIDNIDPAMTTHEKHIEHEIQMAKNWCNIVQSSKNINYLKGYLFTGWMAKLQTNGWNGLYPLAFFGWKNLHNGNYPQSWKEISKNPDGSVKLDYNDQSVLKVLEKTR